MNKKSIVLGATALLLGGLVMTPRLALSRRP